MVALRRERARANGHDTVVAETLTRCQVTESDVEQFIDRYMPRAIDGSRRLGERVCAATGVRGDWSNHFGYFMQGIAAGARMPLFELDECLEFIFQVADSVFGLRMTVRPSRRAHTIRVDVSSAAGEVGQINFDLWDTAAKSTSAQHTRGLRNRTDWSGLVQTPVAYVSCRFLRDDENVKRITFQNVHSLFHEFGHAVNHLLIRRRISNRSGLEYLPLERLEFLSMWFEKWVYHPEFENAVTLPRGSIDTVHLCRRLKALEYQRTYVARAVTAALDFEVHRAHDGGLARSFALLDERYGLSRHTVLADYPAYFTWPMYQANPGANFAYLWGASDSIEKFLRFERLTLDEIRRRPEMREEFSTCFEYALPTPTPASGAITDFYDRIAAKEPAT
jgi:oligopeptidase A